MPRKPSKPKPPPSMTAKPGAKRGLSTAEMAIIREGAEAGHTDAEIAAILGRREDVVARARVRLVGLPARETPDPVDVRDRVTGPAQNPKNNIITEFRATIKHKEVRRQLTPEELKMYEDQYADIVYQLGDDITPTERIAIHKVVFMSVQMGRNAEDQLRARADAAAYLDRAARLEANAPDTLEAPRTDECQRKIDALHAAVGRAEQRLTTLTRDHNALSSEQQKLFEDLKSTRNQRLDRATKVSTIQDLLKQLMHEGAREQEGRRAELMRQAMGAEAARLARPYEYADGSVDRPLLTPETVEGAAARPPQRAPADADRRPEAAAPAVDAEPPAPQAPQEGA